MADRTPDPRRDRFLDEMLDAALEAGASDVHLEPYDGGGRVRFRVDGALRSAGACRSEERERAIGRVKVLSGLVAYQYDRIQEGRLAWLRNGRSHDLRVTIVPTPDGERAAIRIFGADPEMPRLDALGFSGGIVSSLERIAHGRRGLFAITGPMSSGKTTTLHALVSWILAEGEERTLVGTVEDPVERRIRGALQIEVAPEREITFARGLGALLRQDCEVIVVGEIRDAATARSAVDAALTGHLVLATLHVGTPAESLDRLVHLGVDDRLARTAVVGALSQRLVRLLCRECREGDGSPCSLPGARVRRAPALAGYRRGEGCPRCAGTGYRGRSAVGELVESDPGAGMVRDEEGLAERGVPSLADSALALLEAGDTDLAEVLRSLRT